VVQDVRGWTVSVQFDAGTEAGLAFIDGHGYRIGQIGSFVRIPLGYRDLFGFVSQVGASAVPERLREEEPFGNRWLTIQLVGEGSGGKFSRGVSQYPTVGDTVHVVAEADLEGIYGASGAANFIRIGHVASAQSIPALLDLNSLVTRHSAIVGATGSGKSTTVAAILRSLSNSTTYPSARVVVLDVHGEYATALGDYGAVFRAQADASTERRLEIPYWALSFEELVELCFGEVDDAARGYLLERITAMKRESFEAHPIDGLSVAQITVDTPVPFSAHQLWMDLYKTMYATHTAPATGQAEATEALLLNEDGTPVQAGDVMAVVPPLYRPQDLSAGANPKIYLSGSTLNLRRPLEKFAAMLRDRRYDFLFKPGLWLPAPDGSVQADLDQLLNDWIGGPHTVAVLDLSGIPVSILTNLVGSLLRIMYDALFWARNLSEGGRERPLLVVLEEAHAYVGRGADTPASLAVRRIVKEGRKYGVGAMIVSQRPSEIDPTILSQCGTLIAMRLGNTSDRQQVTGTVTDNLLGLMDMLPVLRTGEAIVVGESVSLPLRVLIDQPPLGRRPDSNDPLVFNETGPGGWNRAQEKSDYRDVVLAWRRQNPRSPRVVEVLNTAIDAIVANVAIDASEAALKVEADGGNDG
jgi:hypothetical protein